MVETIEVSPEVSHESRPTQGTGKTFNLDEIPVGETTPVLTQEDLNRVLAAHAQWIAGVFDLDQSIPPGRAHLTGVDLTPFNLRYRDLSGAQLSGAVLQEMDLTGVNLTAANLNGANLACANLGGAKLRGAKLHGTDLRGADLTGVSLAGVDLSHAILKSDP